MKNRLTYSCEFCEDIMMCNPKDSICSKEGCNNRRIWEKLKAYEDTGLTPEEIMALIKVKE